MNPCKKVNPVCLVIPKKVVNNALKHISTVLLLQCVHLVSLSLSHFRFFTFNLNERIVVLVHMLQSTNKRNSSEMPHSNHTHICGDMLNDLCFCVSFCSFGLPSIRDLINLSWRVKNTKAIIYPSAYFCREVVLPQWYLPQFGGHYMSPRVPSTIKHQTWGQQLFSLWAQSKIYRFRLVTNFTNLTKLSTSN